jgi:hypothetical protein
MLKTVSASSALRLNEVQVLLSHIVANELAPPQIEPASVAILRGMFYVHLYGYFEYSINKAVESLLINISSKSIKYNELDHIFYAAALDAKFTSCESPGKRRAKWERRKNLLETQVSNGEVNIPDTMFSYDLQNIWTETLVYIFNVLGINIYPLPDKAYSGYIDELVDKRNAVAHGRESPALIGIKRCAELQKILNVANETVAHVIACFEAYVSNLEMIKADHRASYASAR